ncbi:MAG: DUF1667 domain-containing protein [Dorea sp.]|jgi:CxxC motif-containing protein|nr:DUF1667 domain-containing protein [Dorea sp.]
MEEKNLICINCPMGCMLTVAMEGSEIISVAGNTCRRGDSYARKELTNPTRIVTTTVKVSGGRESMVSVKTKEDIPKGKVLECVRELKDVVAAAPVRIGDVILEDAAKTGVNIVATKNVEAK